MNALVAIRANATGLYSPTPDQRASVQSSLESAAVTASATASVDTTESAAADATFSNVEITAATDISTVTTETATTASSQAELDKDAFLQLLVLELQNQDPLEPVDNSDMLAQLAQFSALESMTNLNDSFEALSGNVDQLNFITASTLLGTTVTGVDLNGDIRTGVVEAVHLDGSNVVLTVDGEFMYVAGLLSIEHDTAATETETEDGGEEGDGEEAVEITDPDSETDDTTETEI